MVLLELIYFFGKVLRFYVDLIIYMYKGIFVKMQSFIRFHDELFFKF